MYYVYAIGSILNLSQKDYNSCYIGVTNNIKNRWSVHCKSRYTIAKAIHQNDWNCKDNMVIIFEGTSEECFNQEWLFRPLPMIGLNEAPGGRGGYTVYTKERATKISHALRDKKKTSEHRSAISISRKANGSAVGERNPKAKVWVIVDFFGKEYIIKGMFENFCKDRCILPTVLIRYRGKVVPVASPKSRSADDTHRQYRLNTVGWLLK
jgi:predicted GIY-YIG superfamily endonuclease